MKTSTYNTIAIDDTRDAHMYCASGCQKKPRLIELAAPLIELAMVGKVVTPVR